MNDLLYECIENDIANYADDRTAYSYATDIPTVISELQAISTKIFSWFGNIHMKSSSLSTKSPIYW